MENVLENVRAKRPRIVYLSGKTCTGKTTFANLLEQFGYRKIELDTIVTRSVVIPFNAPPADAFRAAYREDGPREHTEAFIEAAKQEIAQKLLTDPLVIEGAIAKGKIIKEILPVGFTDMVFIYLHPVNIDVYTERIRSRFEAGVRTNNTGLPKDFWALVKERDLAKYIETNSFNPEIADAIHTYAANSMRQSGERLNNLKVYFPDITVVYI